MLDLGYALLFKISVAKVVGILLQKNDERKILILKINFITTGNPHCLQTKYLWFILILGLK